MKNKVYRSEADANPSAHEFYALARRTKI